MSHLKGSDNCHGQIALEQAVRVRLMLSVDGCHGKITHCGDIQPSVQAEEGVPLQVNHASDLNSSFLMPYLASNLCN